MITVTLDDVLALLQELENNAIKNALIPRENVYQHYAQLGAVDGIKHSIIKIRNHYERENYSK